MGIVFIPKTEKGSHTTPKDCSLSSFILTGMERLIVQHVLQNVIIFNIVSWISKLLWKKLISFGTCF